MHCTDEGSRHWTLVTSDVVYQRVLVEAKSTPGLLAGFEVSTEKYPQRRAGWPNEWTIGAGA